MVARFPGASVDESASRDAEKPESRTDVLIMATLPKELRAVMDQSRVEWEHLSDTANNLEYWRSSLPNGLRVALAAPTFMGPVSAAIATTQAITALAPSRVILTGIAAGIGEDVRLGDIIVSDQIVDYDAGSLKGGAYAPRWRAYAADSAIVRSTKSLWPEKSWFEAKDLINLRPKDKKTKSDIPEVHVGTVLAGSKVVRDSRTVDVLRKTWNQAVGLEMEGGGGAAAAHEHPNRPTFIIIKGVSDYGDRRKNNEWQEYAANSAAIYVFQLLAGPRPTIEDLRQPPPPPAPEPEKEPWKAPDQFAELGLRKIDVKTMLRTGFDTNELMDLCSDLEIEWESLPHRTTIDGATEDIVSKCTRHGKVTALVKRIKELRPWMFK